MWAVKPLMGLCRLDFPTLATGHGGGKPSVAVRSGGVSSLPVFRNATAPAAVVRASPTDFPSLGATLVGTKATATKTKNQGGNKGKERVRGCGPGWVAGRELS